LLILSSTTGSVKPDNSDELASEPDIDGFLVGGASLKAADFFKIASAANAKKSAKL
jgi:triosephosphate isomerase